MSNYDKILNKNFKQLNSIGKNMKGGVFKEICKFIFDKPNKTICSTRLRELYKENSIIKFKLKQFGGPKKFIETNNFIFKHQGNEYKLYWEIQNRNGFGLMSLKKIVTYKDLDKINERLNEIENKLG